MRYCFIQQQNGLTPICHGYLTGTMVIIGYYYPTATEATAMGVGE